MATLLLISKSKFMENVIHYLGADLSKDVIDFVSFYTKAHLQIENTRDGFKQLLKWLKQQKIVVSSMMIVMEHTGFYSHCLEEFLHQQGISFCKVNALEIKRSMGITRGKSDKIDAARIASYAFAKKDTLTPQAKPSEALQRLKMLVTSRELLVKHRASLKCAIKEFQNIGMSKNDLVLQSQLKVVKAMGEQIDRLEKEIEHCIQQDPVLVKNYSLLTSIKGVGPVVATTTLIVTQNFTRFATGRKFACFCGTAPFEHTSGSSIRGKTRVSPLADKRMKSLLDRAACSAITCDPELKAFFERRTAMGKIKKSTINIVRNKIIHRMFAVIKRQTQYTIEYSRAA